MVAAFLSNAFGLARLSFPSLRGFDQVSAVLQVRQSWEVFAPGPVHFRRAYRVVAHGADGATVDPISLMPTPLFRSDGNLRIAFASPRWTKYFTRLDELGEPAWEAFGRYLCRQAQARMPAGSAIRQVEITLMTDPIEGTPPAERPLLRRAFDCASHSA